VTSGTASARFGFRLRQTGLLIGLGVGAARAGLAQEPARYPDPAIEDNSFFVEEAHNQEPRVVQHINNLWLSGDHLQDLFYTFTQEWPVGGQRNQLSYTIPLTRLEGQSLGIGDVLLNYRYQLGAGGRRWAVAPRFSLILPTGSVAKELGFGTVGVQLNLPASIRLSRQLVTHWDAGVTVLPRAEGAGAVHRGLVNYNLNGSLIGPLMLPVQVMLEGVVNFVAVIDSTGEVRRETVGIASPGIRAALNLGTLQIVPGIAAPVLLSQGRARVGLFSYLSFEHPF
jgi:hypothetical protein